MNASDIAQILKAKPSGKGYRARCPAHADKHPSLWFTDAITKSNPTGKLRFQCKASCDYREIRMALNIQSKERSNNSPTRISSDEIDDDPLGQIVRMRKITNLWKRAVPIVKDSPAWTYLIKTRKVLAENTPIPSVMREVPDLGYFTSGDNDELLHVGNFPAIITRMDNVNGNLVTLHRTYLKHDGSGKAPVDKAKKLMQSPVDGCTDGAAIQLFQPGILETMPEIEARTLDPNEDPTKLVQPIRQVILGLSEGIESALAAFTLFGTPTWAAWSASGLSKIEIPPEVTDLIIFGDNDSAGRKAVNDLILRLKEESPKLRVVIKLPSTPGADWADELK